MFLLMILFTISCKKNDKQVESEFLTNAIDKAKIDSDTHCIVVLPGLGCHGCIQEGEAFMRDNIDNLNVFFILTKNSSLKILQQKIGIKVSEHSNIFIDRENLFDIPTNNGIYPCIIFLKNGKIENHEFQCPQNNSAFGKLSKSLSNKKL